VAWEAIEDSTRPTSPARGWRDREAFIKHEKKIFLWGYERQLMQSQPAHVEVIAEKLTVQSILAPVADRFTLPLTIARGMCSGTAKQALFDRFSASGKEALVLLIASDLDPAGETIASDFLHYLVRDCDIDEERIAAWKLAILEVIDVDAYESELAQEERDLEAIAQLKQRILGK
jgi:hypothetical protein